MDEDDELAVGEPPCAEGRGVEIQMIRRLEPGTRNHPWTNEQEDGEGRTER